MVANAEFHALVAQLEPIFDAAVVSGDADELFASGYLRGHFDLAVAQLELQDNADAAAILPAVRASVEAHKNELNPTDQALIQRLLDQLEAVAATSADVTTR
ncbi:MAG TPA: YfcL family protein [Pseudidiomarina sp.]|nr:YfcL family protein [Pseudidiomarina sp.]